MGINLLATPGLGTIMAGRYASGAVQLVIATAGFALFLAWMLAKFKSLIDESAPPAAWKWQAGLGLFVVAWILSLISSRDFVSKTSSKIPPKLP